MSQSEFNLFLVWFVLGGFSCFYLSISLAQLDGPFGLFARMRNFFVTDNWISRGVRCPYCWSWYISFILALCAPGQPLLLAWLGLAGLSSFLYRIAK